MKNNPITKAPRYIEATIEKLVFGGQGLAHVDGKPCFIWNALPQEQVKARILASRKGIIEAVAEEINNPSKDRVGPVDEHYLSTAPWEILTTEAEKRWKVEIAKEQMIKLPTSNDQLEIVGDGIESGYRNKVEFGFFEDEVGEVHLSFFNRGSRFPRPVTGFSLVSPAIWQTAEKTLKWIKENKIKRFDLKTLIIRSNRKGEVIAALFATNEKLKFKELPKLEENLLGFFIYYSSYKSPASIISGNIAGEGQDFLEEELLGTKMRYGLHSFFQINIPVFEKTLQKISQHLPKGADVLDFYSGVGSISIPLTKHVNSAILVDSNTEAIEFAKHNTNFKSLAVVAEQALEYIDDKKILIIDPPRAGLHPDVVKKILEVKPPLVIYLSCNLSTQVRDVSALVDQYDIIDKVIYDYFPRTPHFESLMILKKK